MLLRTVLFRVSLFSASLLWVMVCVWTEEINNNNNNNLKREKREGNRSDMHRVGLERRMLVVFAALSFSTFSRRKPFAVLSVCAYA